MACQPVRQEEAAVNSHSFNCCLLRRPFPSLYLDRVCFFVFFSFLFFFLINMNISQPDRQTITARRASSFGGTLHACLACVRDKVTVRSDVFSCVWCDVVVLHVCGITENSQTVKKERDAAAASFSLDVSPTSPQNHQLHAQFCFPKERYSMEPVTAKHSISYVCMTAHKLHI